MSNDARAPEGEPDKPGPASRGEVTVWRAQMKHWPHLHLGTAVLVALVAGALLGGNLLPRKSPSCAPRTTYSLGDRVSYEWRLELGWPIPCAFVYLLPHDVSILERNGFRHVPISEAPASEKQNVPSYRVDIEPHWLLLDGGLAVVVVAWTTVLSELFGYRRRMLKTVWAWVLFVLASAAPFLAVLLWCWLAFAIGMGRIR